MKIYRFVIPLVCQSACLGQLLEAAKDPSTMARFLESGTPFAWEELSQAKHIDFGAGLICGRKEFNCTTELIGVVNPDQTILLAKGLFGDLYLRYKRDLKGTWMLTGATSVEIRNYPRRHEIERAGGVPFLKISGQGYRGSDIDSEVEVWFDLSSANFKSIFSFSPQGASDFPAARLGRRYTGIASLTGRDSIAVTYDVVFYGGHEDQVLGTLTFKVRYRRVGGAGEFQPVETLLDGKTSGQAWRELDSILTLDGDEKHPEPTPEDLVGYDFAGLKAVVQGQDFEAKTWLREFLAGVKGTPEVLELRRLLGSSAR